MQKIPRVGLGVFVWKDGKFLMGWRHGAHGDNVWSIPGGHLEFGETWEECAKREVMEETGMEVTNVQFVAATNDIFPKDDKHYISIWVNCDWVANKPKVMEPDKLISFEWHTFKDLPSPLFSPWEQLKKAKPELFKD